MNNVLQKTGLPWKQPAWLITTSAFGMYVNHTDWQAWHSSHSSHFVSLYCRYIWCSGRLKVVWLDQGHWDQLPPHHHYQHHLPAGSVRGERLLSATDGLSCFAHGVLSVHTQTHTHREGVRCTTHTLITSVLSLRERGLSCWGLWQPEEEQNEDGRSDRSGKMLKTVDLSNISRQMQTAQEFLCFFFLL